MLWEDLSDEALITKYRDEADKQQADQYINELFRRHHIKVARWCLGFTGDRESAADLAQEICAKAYRNLPYFKGQSKFSTWLYSIARNHSLNAIRSRNSMPEMESDETVMDALPDMVSDNPLKTVERKQLTEIARQFVNAGAGRTGKTGLHAPFCGRNSAGCDYPYVEPGQCQRRQSVSGKCKEETGQSSETLESKSIETPSAHGRNNNMAANNNSNSKIWQDAVSATQECPGIEVLEHVMEGTAQDPRTQNHVSTCPHCQSELALLRKFEYAEASPG